MTEVIDRTADAELKKKHAAMWASGHYEAVATDLISELGPTLVDATGIHEGDLVLDIAAGSGNVAIPAARTGARVIASDLTPELLEEGARRAAAVGAVLEWQVADAEHLPYDDGQFDVAVSAVGIMFAPHHQAAADELVRVVAPGGRIGLASWTPQGFIGQMFATMKPYVAPPPAGVQPPPLWGDEEHVRGPAGRPGHRPARRAPEGTDHALRGAGGLPRVLQDQLRADDLRLRPAAGRGAGGRAGRRPRRPRRAVRRG